MGCFVEPMDMGEDKLEEETRAEALALILFLSALSACLCLSLSLSLSLFLLSYFAHLWTGPGYFLIPNLMASYSSNLLVRPTEISWLQF